MKLAEVQEPELSLGVQHEQETCITSIKRDVRLLTHVSINQKRSEPSDRPHR